jgi:hypothetical protein
MLSCSIGAPPQAQKSLQDPQDLPDPAIALSPSQRQWRCLDLFSGAGGATRGLQLAGFHVTGIDINPQPQNSQLIPQIPKLNSLSKLKIKLIHSQFRFRPNP